jgi:hypothetical protein
MRCCSGWPTGAAGRKAKAGFYAYDDKGERLGLWEGLAAQVSAGRGAARLTEVQHRLLIAQVLEAVRALEEGVLTDIREGDVGAILGWGFAPWSGGPFSLARHDRRGPRGGDLRCGGSRVTFSIAISAAGTFGSNS